MSRRVVLRASLSDRWAMSGFTLIELLIVAVLVAVLAAIALPSYNEYVIRTRRSDGKEALIQLALDQERFRSTCPAYVPTARLTTARPLDNEMPPDGIDAGDCAAGGLGYPNPALSPEQYYTLSIVAASSVDFTIRATARGSQTRDDQCTRFNLTQN